MTETPEDAAHLIDASSHELAWAIKNLTFEMRGLREDMRSQQKIVFGPNGDDGMLVQFKVLQSKCSSAFWLAGVAVAGLVIQFIGIAFFIIINYGPKGIP